MANIGLSNYKNSKTCLSDIRRDVRRKTKKPANSLVAGFLHSGSGGIRTHVPLRTTAFRVRLVMTTSIRFHRNTAF